MRPVNLLPERDRVKGSAKAVEGSSYAVLGVLAVLLLAVGGYVLTSNQINTRTSEIARARTSIEAAQTRASTLGPFQRFAQIKEERLSSVKSLAQARFDWERFMRELALILPDGSSLTEVTASASGTPADAGAAAAPAPTADPTAAAAGAPSVHLVGCAESQPTVAVVLVRLRQLHRATDVQLADSSQQDDGASSAGGDSAPSSSSGCGSGRYQFDATVTFDPAPADEIGKGDGSVPSRLGGGS